MKKQGILFLVAVVIGLSLIAVFGQASQSKTTMVKMDALRYECCAVKVSPALAHLPGVQKVDIDSKSSHAVATFYYDLISCKSIKEASKGAMTCLGKKDCCKGFGKCCRSTCDMNCLRDYEECVAAGCLKYCCPESEWCVRAGSQSESKVNRCCRLVRQNSAD